MFVLYEHQNQAQARDGTYDVNTQIRLQQVADQVVYYSKRCYDDVVPDYATMSPYIPLSLCQAAVVRRREAKSTGSSIAMKDYKAMERILGLFALRWTNSCEFHSSFHKSLKHFANKLNSSDVSTSIIFSYSRYYTIASFILPNRNTIYYQVLKMVHKTI